MPKRIVVFTITVMMFCVSTAQAQGTHQFLGKAREVPDRFTAKHGIRYNTQGFDAPETKWEKRIRTWQEHEVPESIIEQLLAYPGSPDAIGQWIDDAFDQALAQFTACNGKIAKRAAKVSKTDLSVTIMPSAFFDPSDQILLAGAYYPTPKQIKVLNIYYIWEGPHKGWLRHARDLLVYEMQNYFAVCCGIQAEPRTLDWPCKLR